MPSHSQVSFKTTVLGPVVLALVFAVLVQNADAAKFW